MSPPELWLVAGPNGAGKTTLLQREPLRDWLAYATMLNADDATLRLLRERGHAGFSTVPENELKSLFITAAETVQRDAEAILDEGGCVCLETVLSTGKFRPLVERVLACGGRFFLVYVAVKDPSVSCGRVQHRASLGGHDVAPEKVATRWHRSLEQLQWFARRASVFLAYDNSDSSIERAPLLIARSTDGVLTIHEPEAVPALTASLRQAWGQAGNDSAIL